MVVGRRRFLLAAALATPWTCRRRHAGSGASAHSHHAMRPRIQAPARPPLHPDSLARFVDELPIPPVLKAEGTRADPHEPGRQIPYYRLSMRETLARIHRDLPPTRMWGFAGSVPGPTIEARTGQGMLIEWANDLPTEHLLPIDHGICGAGADRPDVRTVVHVHGARVPPESDGYPEDWYTPGHAATYHYPNGQDAATLWYHDHAMGIERLNQYAGLFGFYLVRDAVEDALELPRGQYEVPLVLCDRLLYADGQLHYPVSESPEAPWVSEVNGDAMLVNGKLFPFLNVEPRRYRFRIVNASNSRFFDLSLPRGLTFRQIGSDQGLLSAPVAVDRLALAPAERADVLVDLTDAAGQNVVLASQTLQLLQLRVGPRTSAAAPRPLPAKLHPVARMPASAAIRTRTLTLNEYEDPRTHTMLMLLDAKRWHEPVTERPVLGTVELWNLVNLTEDAHPIHLHEVRFQVLERQPFEADEYLTSGKTVLVGQPVPPAPNEAGWKDTVVAGPGLITRILVRFDGYAGRFVWHCHVLEHAANEMMRPFEIVAR